MLLKIALNGARPKFENQNIPQTIEEITKQVKEVCSLGYNVFHIHCYNENGIESLEPGDVERLVSSVKEISQGIQIGISTGDWIEPNLSGRSQLINSWKIIPDFVSVNMIEDNVIDICNVLIKKGVMIEAGLNEKKAAEIFMKSGIDEHCVRVLIEPESENYEEAIVTVNEIERVLGGNQLPRLLHGFNKASWPLLREAKKREYGARMGMEDTIYNETGDVVQSNFELIKAAHRIINEE
jgi:uncharacterized protein (DUF849 family)